MASHRTEYSEDELLASHPYTKAYHEEGRLLHGGFDEEGRYFSPRTLQRWPAIHAWQAQLKQRGLPLIDASPTLLKAKNYPNKAQQKLLLQNDIAKPFAVSLVITGIVEARGVALITIPPISFQDIIKEDIRAAALGHLHKG